MLYLKRNVPAAERVLRVLAGAGVAAAALWLRPDALGAVIALSAGGLVLSGLVGWCPMCAMVGRRLDRGG